MRGLLNDFRLKGLSLTRKAFEYLLVMAADEAKLKESTQKVIIILKEVGGICYLTGVHSLIEIFSVLRSLAMAKFVIENTERRLSNYNLLFKEMCRRCEFGEARNLMDEMRNEGYPLVQNYNRLISTLLKNGEIGVAYKMFQEMKEKEKDCPPDALTYEVFICHYCNDGNLEIAFEFFADMMSRGLRPRLSTHAAFIRGYFNSNKYEEAHKYIVESDDKYSRSVNYSLLARLHLKTGNAVKAENILSELIEKGLKPNHKVYMEVRERLQKAGMEKLATDLEMKLCQLEHRP
ncbi:pentatricopeptide repeat-containing protein At3g22470, mitochondrial-like [Euphorbia lathyris]|uniref:pentatricopeptide repeat-containing protein At3g22470, mitochondrial-like n=1 Tax=Euphorbia lathyris TaxID=212925 RepID=UPI003313777F